MDNKAVFIDDSKLKISALRYEVPQTLIVIMDDSYDASTENLEGNWYRLDRILVREQNKKSWFHIKMLKLFFGIELLRGKRTS